MNDLFDETQIDGSFIKEKTIRGIAFSAFASGIKTVIAFFGNVILARILAPSVFGAFGIITFVCQQVPVVLYDIGLSDALIQRKTHQPKKRSERYLLSRRLPLHCLSLSSSFSLHRWSATMTLIAMVRGYSGFFRSLSLRFCSKEFPLPFSNVGLDLIG